MRQTSNRDIRIVALHRVGRMFQENRFNGVIGVNKSDIPPFADVQSEIPGLGDPSTGQMMNMYTGILLLGFIQHGGRLAITGVVKEEPLKIGQGLA